MANEKDEVHAPDVTFPSDRVHLLDGTTRPVVPKDAIKRGLLAEFLRIKGKEERIKWLKEKLGFGPKDEK